MALYRQGSGSVQADRAAFRAYEHHHGNASSTRVTADMLGNASARTPFKLNRGKRFSRVARIRQCSIGVLVLIIFFIVGITLLGSNYRFSDRGDQNPSESGKFYDNQGHSIHFAIWNLRRHDPLAETDKKKENSGDSKIPNQGDMRKQGHNSVDAGDSYISKVLQFGQGSVASSRDSRDWDRDDRRRGKVFSERDSEFSDSDSMSVSNQETIDLDKGKKNNAGDSFHGHQRAWIKDSKQDKDNVGARHFKDHKRHAKSTGKPDGENFGNGGLYNEKGRDELKLYEAQYEEALKNELGQNVMGKADRADSFNNEHEKAGFVKTGNAETHLSIEGRDSGSLHTQDVLSQLQVDVDDEYDDGIDEYDIHAEETEGLSSDRDIPDVLEKQDEHQPRYGKNMHKENPGFPKQKGLKRVPDNGFDKESSLFIHGFNQDKAKGNIASILEPRDSLRKADTEKKRTSLTRRSKRHKHASTACELRFLDSSVRPVEPKENPKFANFSLQFVEREEKPDEVDDWEPRFAGHQSLEEREDSFYARDQKLTCGFVKGPKGSPSTGFDLSEEDTKFLNSCHIAVSSCIFGNSDNLRTPTGKKVTRSSKKNVCFVMFVDEKTLGTMSSEGRQLDEKGFIGLWKVVVVRNLPYMDMRRTGKVPKFLTHRLFPSARYSIWLDSKLRLQSDPLLILEYFLWRRGYEYAISNHYDRHCVWEEVMQNKRLNKFNHTIIDEQFAFYQADGLTQFNSSDPNKLLPSHVPEGSFIVRAHTPMSNLFSCLWFNEVDRFTPRDQLSFAYTYLKLQRMNPEKHFQLNMFKDCERRAMAKLFHHRADEKNLS